MATRRATVDHIVDLLTDAAKIQALPMFGEYGLYGDTKIFALICDDQLFIKITPATADAGFPKGAPYPGASDHFAIPPEYLEDPDTLVPFVRRTLDALPKPRKVPKRLL